MRRGHTSPCRPQNLSSMYKARRTSWESLCSCLPRAVWVSFPLGGGGRGCRSLGSCRRVSSQPWQHCSRRVTNTPASFTSSSMSSEALVISLASPASEADFDDDASITCMGCRGFGRVTFFFLAICQVTCSGQRRLHAASPITSHAGVRRHLSPESHSANETSRKVRLCRNLPRVMRPLSRVFLPQI